jgi:hypothetical protein
MDPRTLTGYHPRKIIGQLEKDYKVSPPCYIPRFYGKLYPTKYRLDYKDNLYLAAASTLHLSTTFLGHYMYAFSHGVCIRSNHHTQMTPIMSKNDARSYRTQMYLRA